MKFEHLKIIGLFLILTSCQFGSEIVEQDCSDLKYILELDLPLSEIRIFEKKLSSTEAFTESQNEFGYRKRALKSNEKNQPKIFIQELDGHSVETYYYYEFPDSNVYAIVYEWENLYGYMGGIYPINEIQMDNLPSEGYLKCEFENLSKSLIQKLGDFRESQNFGIVREWELANKTVHLKMTLGARTNHRLRLVIFDK